MSASRTMYDANYIRANLKQNRNIFDHIINPAKYVNNPQCVIENSTGMVTRNCLATGSLVDIESALQRGQGRR